MAEFDTLSVKLNRDNLSLEEIDKCAEEFGINRSKFTTLALNMLVNFDRELWKRIVKYKEALHIPEWLVIQNMLIKKMLQDGIKESFHLNNVLDEFIFVKNDQGLVEFCTGNDLTNKLSPKYYEQINALSNLLSEIQVKAIKEPLSKAEKEFFKAYAPKAYDDYEHGLFPWYESIPNEEP